MKFELKNIKIIFDDSLFNEICKQGISHFPNEFGGLLFGKYQDEFKTLCITKTILPLRHKGFPYLFERSTDGIEKRIEEMFQNEKLYYVGEWHTHPNGNSIFSNLDLQSMIEIAKCDTVKITNPVLLILGTTKNSIKEYSIYYYQNKQLLKYGEANNT